MAGTDQTRKMIAEGPAIVLVEPQLGENIGMVARAMANFGLVDLRLVNPRDGWPSEKARAAASRADHVIDAVTVFDDLPSAIADLHVVMATTARQRDMAKAVLTPKEAVARLRDTHDAGRRGGIVFGRERWGLENDEVALANTIVTFPVNPAFASLNIAQAVLLMSYEWMNAAVGQLKPFEQSDAPAASRADLQHLYDHLEGALDEANYFHPPDRRERMVITLRNIFADAGLSEPQIKTLRGVVAALERRWLRKKK